MMDPTVYIHFDARHSQHAMRQTSIIAGKSRKSLSQLKDIVAGFAFIQLPAQYPRFHIAERRGGRKQWLLSLLHRDGHRKRPNPPMPRARA